MPPKHVNTFLVGADPELIFLNPPNLVNVHTGSLETGGLFGFDHNGFVVEPHPTPSRSVRELCSNIRMAIDYLHFKFPRYQMRAGAYIETPQRTVTLGGHVHLDMRALTNDQLQGMDDITRALEFFNILPATECALRRGNRNGYGRFSDVRAEHGHVEYRTMASWLYDPKVSMLAMTCIKLAAVDPTGIRAFRSWNNFLGWLEGFRLADDDVRWMFDRGYFNNPLSGLDVSRNLSTAWRASNERGKAIAASISAKKTAQKLVGVHAREAARAAERRALEVLAQANVQPLQQVPWTWNWAATPTG